MSVVRAGRYELLQPLGAGGMAELFLARVAGDPRGHIFALKRVLPQHARDRRFAEMFQREVGIASTVCHPNLVPVLDHGEADGQCFMVMEYVHGEDLATLLDASAEAAVEVPINVAISIVVQAAEGLHHLHEQPARDDWTPQLVHRDVSPSNVLVAYDGAVKVADFGIATATAHTRTTEAGTLKGKAGYMSPEQCRGDALDRRSDVFALGILLYETTVGERLFTADNDYALMNKIIGGRFDPPSRRRSGYPPGLEAIVHRALAGDRQRRYATAAELAEALRRFAHASRLTLGSAAIAAWVAQLMPRRDYPLFPPMPTPVVAPARRRAPASRTRRGALGWVAAAGGVAIVAVTIAATRNESRSAASPEPQAPAATPAPAALAPADPPQSPTLPSTPAHAPAASTPVSDPPPPAHVLAESDPEIVILDDPSPADSEDDRPVRKRKRPRKHGDADPTYDLDAPRPPQ